MGVTNSFTLQNASFPPVAKIIPAKEFELCHAQIRRGQTMVKYLTSDLSFIIQSYIFFRNS